MLDDRGRKAVAAVGDFSHRASLPSASLPSYPVTLTKPLPPTVGLLLFGVLLGPHVLGFFGEHRPIADFFAELGKLLLMFSAGLEIDLTLFRSAQTRAITFGIVTTSVPLVFGTLLGLGFGYALIPAIVVGSLLASHTLLSIPIVERLGILRLEGSLVKCDPSIR